MKKIEKEIKTIHYLAISCCTIVYILLGYFTKRSDFEILYPSIILLFLNFIFLSNSKFTVHQFLWLGFFFRIILLGVIPFLSQDFYRFIWDGQLLTQGLNPYEYTPFQYLKNTPDTHLPFSNGYALIEGMGSLNASHYSNYPPLSQLLYGIAAFFGNKSILSFVIALRILIIGFEIGIGHLLSKLLTHINSNPQKIALYMLNPFIIIELTGNLHLEGVMLFFTLLGTYLLFIKKEKSSAVAMAIAILTKLLPIIYLPQFLLFFTQSNFQNSFNRRNIKKIFKYIEYVIIVNIIVILGFYIFYKPHLIENFGTSIGLWFKKFEFNASIYYIIRELGYFFIGWNIIETAGKTLAIVTFLSILGISFLRNNQNQKTLITSMLFSHCMYLLFTTTVHPWYLVLALGLSILTHFRFMQLWSFIIFSSYWAYQDPEFDENLSIVFIGYTCVIIYVIYEFIKNYTNWNNACWSLGVKKNHPK